MPFVQGVGSLLFMQNILLMEAKDFLNFIGARVMLNKKALAFSKDCIIRETGDLKSTRQGTVMGISKNKGDKVHVLWDGNTKIVYCLPEFLEVIFFDKSQKQNQWNEINTD